MCMTLNVIINTSDTEKCHGELFWLFRMCRFVAYGTCGTAAAVLDCVIFFDKLESIDP